MQFLIVVVLALSMMAISLGLWNQGCWFSELVSRQCSVDEQRALLEGLALWGVARLVSEHDLVLRVIESGGEKVSVSWPPSHAFRVGLFVGHIDYVKRSDHECIVRAFLGSDQSVQAQFLVVFDERYESATVEQA